MQYAAAQVDTCFFEFFLEPKDVALERCRVIGRSAGVAGYRAAFVVEGEYRPLTLRFDL
jgi:hypothetical protein